MSHSKSETLWTSWLWKMEWPSYINSEYEMNVLLSFVLLKQASYKKWYLNIGNRTENIRSQWNPIIFNNKHFPAFVNVEHQLLHIAPNYNFFISTWLFRSWIHNIVCKSVNRNWLTPGYITLYAWFWSIIYAML